MGELILSWLVAKKAISVPRVPGQVPGVSGHVPGVSGHVPGVPGHVPAMSQKQGSQILIKAIEFCIFKAGMCQHVLACARM